MRESPLRLNDKTVILYGPGHSLTQGLASFLNEQGADVAFVGPYAGSMRKFADNLMDNRQVNQSFGRSASFEMKLESEKDDLDAISQVTQTLGGFEVIIDTHLDAFTSDTMMDCHRVRMAKSALKFLESRKRGRVIFMSNLYELKSAGAYDLVETSDDALHKLINELKLASFDKNITINGIKAGITEEFLLNNFKGVPLKESIENFKTKYPGFFLVEALEVATTATFLSSPISSGISGHIIKVNKGLKI